MSVTEIEAQPTTRPQSGSDAVAISIDGHTIAATEGELLVEAILREKEIPHICYHSPLMGPIETYDTCLVEVGGRLVRACPQVTRTAHDHLLRPSARAEAAWNTLLLIGGLR